MTNLIIDYDGTLHDSIIIYAPAFRLAYEHLVLLGLAQARNWKDSEISKWLGFSSKDMWDDFMPDLPQIRKDECDRLIGGTMLKLVSEGKARLYFRALETLQKLKNEGYNLIFLSNCKNSYMQMHIKHFHLDEYFAAFYCGEDFGFMPKHVIFNSIKENHSGDYVVIGDRFHDMEIAQRHGLKSIGCTYGYGEEWEFSSSTTTVSRVEDIVFAVNRI